MRRTHLRGRQNVLKRLLIHVGAFNLSLVVRTLLGSGTPRELSSRSISLIFVFLFSTQGASAPADEPKCSFSTSKFGSRRNRRYLRYKPRHLKTGNCATGC